MNELGLGNFVFYLLATFTIVSAGGVAFSRNILYSAFSLMATLLGVAGLYVCLAADFVAVIQVLIYVGGVVVLALFAIMLTHSITDVRISNRSVGRVPAVIVLALFGVIMGRAILLARWPTQPVEAPVVTTAALGNALLDTYVLPFELASVVLLATLIGAVVLSRKELREG